MTLHLITWNHHNFMNLFFTFINLIFKNLFKSGMLYFCLTFDFHSYRWYSLILGKHTREWHTVVVDRRHRCHNKRCWYILKWSCLLIWSLWVVAEGISYFCLARNLIRRIISPNQDDLSYSTRSNFPGSPNSLAELLRSVQTSHCLLFNNSSCMDTMKEAV